MKKNLLFLLLPLLFLACKKDKKDSQPPAQPDEPKKLVIESFYLDSAGYDKTHLFEYDAEGRFTKIQFRPDDKAEFTYDAAGNLLKKTITYILPKPNPYYDVYEYSYDKGFPKSGTIKQYKGDKLYETTDVTYTVTNGRVSKIFLKNNYKEAENSLFYDDNGNVTKSSWIEKRINYTAHQEINYTYYTSKSEFFDSRVKFILDLDFIEFYSPNALKSLKTQGTPSQTTVFYTTAFGDDGFPTTSKFNVTGFSGSSTAVITYKYKTIQ